MFGVGPHVVIYKKLFALPSKVDPKSFKLVLGCVDPDAATLDVLIATMPRILEQERMTGFALD